MSIIQNLNLKVQSGQMLAIIGSTGKSNQISLFDQLSGKMYTAKSNTLQSYEWQNLAEKQLLEMCHLNTLFKMYEETKNDTRGGLKFLFKTNFVKTCTHLLFVS